MHEVALGSNHPAQLSTRVCNRHTLLRWQPLDPGAAVVGVAASTEKVYRPRPHSDSGGAAVVGTARSPSSSKGHTSKRSRRRAATADPEEDSAEDYDSPFVGDRGGTATEAPSHKVWLFLGESQVSALATCAVLPVRACL